MMQPNSSASVHSSGSGPRSPSMLKTPSVMSSLRWVAGRLREDLARRVDVLVRKHLDGRPAQPAAVDDARVIQLVGDHHVVLGEDGGDGARVRGEPALEHDDGLGLLEGGEAPFELHVDVHGARNRADRSRSRRRGRESRRAPVRAAGCVVRPR